MLSRAEVLDLTVNRGPLLVDRLWVHRSRRRSQTLLRLDVGRLDLECRPFRATGPFKLKNHRRPSGAAGSELVDSS